MVTCTDLVLPCGAIDLEIQRSLQVPPGRQGLLGTRWQMSWESRLFKTNQRAVIEEVAGILTYTREGSEQEYKSSFGEKIVLERNGNALRFKSDGTRELFDKMGRLIESGQRNGNKVRLSYGTDGKLSRIEAPRGNALNFTLDQAGKVVRVETSTGRIVEYRYVNDDLTEVRATGRVSVHYGYDSDGRLAQIDNPQSGWVKLTYDSRGRVSSRVWADGAEERHEYNDTDISYRRLDPDGGITSMQWSQDGRREEIVDPLGNKIVLEYDDTGQLVKMTDPVDTVSRFEYDSLGRMVSMEGCCGRITRFEYLNGSEFLKRIHRFDGSEQVFEYDSNGNVTGIREGDQPAMSFNYLSDGLLTSMKGKGVPERRFSYYPNGLVQSETNAMGQTTQFEYDKRGNLFRETDPMGGQSTWTYDDQDRMTSLTDPAGAITRFSYDGRGHLVSETDPTGSTTRYEYDSRGRLSSRMDPIGRQTRYTYDKTDRLVEITDAAGHIRRYAYDKAGNLSQMINPLGGVTALTRNSLGQVIGETDPTGRTWRYEYSADGELSQIVAPGGKITRMARTSDRRHGERIDPGNRTVRYEWDTYGRVRKAVDPSGLIQTYDYDEEGNLSVDSDNRGSKSQYRYDALNRLIEEKANTDLVLAYQYDALGNLTGVRDNRNSSLIMEYDGLGRLTLFADPSGATTKYCYDTSGRLLEEINPLRQIRRFAYNKAGEVSEVSEPSGDRAQYKYDPAGRLSEIRHPAEGVTSFSYDAMGNLVQEKNPGGRTVLYSYDQAGRLMSKTDPKGQTTRYSYDAGGRLDKKLLADGKDISYKYDDSGNLIEVDDGSFPVRFRYDPEGRLIRIAYPALKRRLNYEYDSDGILSKFVDSEGQTFSYEYDAFKRLKAIHLPQGKTIDFRYDIKDRLTAITYPNGVQGKWRYNKSGQPVEIHYTDKSGKVVSGWEYSYNVLGNCVQTKDESNKTIEYRYDSVGQLIVEKTPTEEVRYHYLAGGNRGKLEKDSRKIEYTYNKANRLLAAGDRTFRYDPNGNLIERQGPRGVTRYTYDTENHLVKVVKPDGAEVQFGYSPTGERIWRRDSKGMTHFVTDGIHLLAELDEQLKPKASYLHGFAIDRPLMMLRDGKTFFYHADSLGSTVNVSNQQGTVVLSHSYDAFGVLKKQEGRLDNPFTFAGREWDSETGLYYFRTRYYDPSVGRFVSTDPVPGNFFEPLSMNPYVYVWNNPLTFRDPLGTQGQLSDKDYINQVLTLEGYGPIDYYDPNMGFRKAAHTTFDEAARTTRITFGPRGKSSLIPGRSDRSVILQNLGHENKHVMQFTRPRPESAAEIQRHGGMVDRQLRGTWYDRLKSTYGERGANTIIEMEARAAEVASSRRRGDALGELVGKLGYREEQVSALFDSRVDAEGSRLAGKYDKRIPFDFEQRGPLRAYGQRHGNTDSPQPPSSRPPSQPPTGRRAYSQIPGAKLAMNAGKAIKNFISGPPGKVTEFAQQHGGKVTVVLTAWQLANCRAQGKDIAECATDLAVDSAKGAALVYVITPTGALIVAAVGGTISIYEAGVEAMQQWEDKKDRDAAYKLRDEQTEANLRKLNNELEKMRVRIEKELSGPNADVRAACDALKGPIQSLERSSKSAEDQKKALAELITKLKDASTACEEAVDKAPAKKGEIEAMMPRVQEYEKKVVQGIEWAKAKAVQCRTKEEATKILEMYDSCKGLAAGLQKYVSKAQGLNQELKDLSVKPEIARGAMATAKSMAQTMAADARSAEGIYFATRSEIDRVEDSNRNLLEKVDSVLREIENLRHGFPEDLLAGNSSRFASLRSLAESYKKTGCDFFRMQMQIKNENDMARIHSDAADSLLASAKVDVSGCAEISPADETLETIEGLANNALLTVAEAEDLPQKANDCLAAASGKGKKPFDPNQPYAIVGISPVWTQMKCQISQNTFAMLSRIDVTRTSIIVRQEGFDAILSGNTAIQILSKHGYIRWDNCGWMTTDKYKQFGPGQTAGSPAKTAPKKSRIECLYMFCPMCKGGSLLGVDMAGGQCDLCQKANYANIERCMNE